MARGALGRKPAPQVDEDEGDTAVIELPIDEQPEQAQFRTGQVPEGELELARSVAKRMGWTPKEDWKRDPSKWVDADRFLENTPRELEALKERSRRAAQAAEAVIEEDRRRVREDAEARIRAAVGAGDEDAAVAAARQAAEASSPAPHVSAWIARNEWFTQDQAARAVAVTVTDRLAKEGRSQSEQLDAAEAEVKRRFPEHFGEVETARNEEVRLSEARRVPPATQPGARTTPTVTKEKGFVDLPAEARAQYERHFAKRFQSYGDTPDQARARYARSYWKDKE